MNVSEQIQQEQQQDPKHAGHLGTSSFGNDSDSPPQLLDDAFDSRSFLTSPDLRLNEFDFDNWDTTQTPASSRSGPEISAQPAIEGQSSQPDPRSSDFSSTSTDACQLLHSVDTHPKNPLALQTQQTQKNFTRHHSTPCSSVASSKVSEKSSERREGACADHKSPTCRHRKQKMLRRAGRAQTRIQ